MENKNRAQFSSKFAVVAAAAGSAVGLGNIWRFPYELGSNGGFAFLLIYLLFVFVLGMPVMLSELVIGRRSQANASGAFRVLRPNSRWHLVGLLGVITAFIILSFYFVVAGWSLEYVFQAVANNFVGKAPSDLSQVFTDFTTEAVRPLFWTIVFVFITAFVVLAGVQKGIEKISKILMPLLFVIILILCFRSLTLPRAEEGVKFLFKPDFSKITSTVVLSALGQAFFSLSVGMSCLITYASYVSKKNNLVHTAFEITTLDTLVSVLASVAIFPAVFSLGIDPSKGPELVFITLPNVFTQIPGGYFWAILFFLLLAVAALTSTISLLEVITAYVTEEFKLKRKTVILLSVGVLIISSGLSSLSLGVWSNLQLFGMSLFDFFDYLSSKILLPVGGLFISVFLGWFYPRKETLDELSNGGKLSVPLFNIYFFLLRYIVPVAIVLIFINELGLNK